MKSEDTMKPIAVALVIFLGIFLLIPGAFAAFEKQYKEIPLTYFSERTQPSSQGSAGADAYFLAKIPLDEEGKQATYALLPSAKKDIIARKVRYVGGDLFVYNADGTIYEQMPDIKTTTDKDSAPAQAKNSVIETRSSKGDLQEKLYADDDGRALRLLYQKDSKQRDSQMTSLFYDPSTKKTMPVTPDAADYIVTQQPEKGLALLQVYEKANPAFFSAIKKDGKLVDPKDNSISYELVGDSLIASRQRNNVQWGIMIKPDGTEERVVNGNVIDTDLASALEQTYGDEITGFDGRTAQADGKTITVEGGSARIMKGNVELEQITVVTEDGIKKVAISRNPSKNVYSQRELQWKDESGMHKRVEKNNEQGMPVNADEELVDAKGNKYYIRTDFTNGKASVSTIYDTSGYPVGRVRYDENGKPIPAQSTKIEYVNKLGRVCDPTTDYTCSYQQVDMRIKVGDMIITDACKPGSKNCKTIKECKDDPVCAQAYGETLRAFQRANLGIALNNAYIAARAAEMFNVKNFEFVDKLFSSEFGQLVLGEPSFGICGKFNKKIASQEGILIEDNQLKTLLAYVAGTRSTLVHPDGSREYLYKLNYYVDAQVDDITFNIDLYRGDANIISLLTQDAKVPKGQKASARGTESIVQYSKNFYSNICLRSSKGTTCNRIVDITELAPLPETAQPATTTGGYRVI